METRPHLLRARTLARPLRVACAVSLVAGALTAAVPALADGTAAPAAPPGQKPPCVPATNYLLGYDCELFPLPALPAPGGAAAGAAVVAPAAAAVVVPAAAAGAAVVVPPGAPAVAPEGGAAVTPPVVPETPALTPPPGAPGPPAVTPPTPSSSSGDSGSPSHAPAYVAFAVGAAGVGMTVAFGILALQANSTLNSDCPGGKCPSTESSTASNLKLYDDMADVGLGLAVAGVTTGIILFVTEKGSSSSGSGSRGRHVEPWIGLGSGGVRGSF